METINKISNEELEVIRTAEIKTKITKTQLLERKAYIDNLLAEFEK